MRKERGKEEGREEGVWEEGGCGGKILEKKMRISCHVLKWMKIELKIDLLRIKTLCVEN